MNTLERTVIALGFFDGVHRGHGALGAEPVVFTFDRPPKEVVTGQPVYLINSAEDRQDLIRRLYGIDRIILAPFDREMMTMSWEDFVTELLVKRCGAVHLVAGHDHRFGHKNAGNAQLLREKCAQLGLGCDIIPEVVHDGITVSSTSASWWRRGTWSGRQSFWAIATVSAARWSTVSASAAPSASPR